MNEWECLVIDGFLPCKPFGDPIYGFNRKRNFWVSLIEKHFSKKYQNYTNLQSGSCRSALVDLSGCPVISVLLKKMDEKGIIEIFDLLKRHMGKGHVITCGTKDVNHDNIASHHAYVIQDLSILEDERIIGNFL